MRYFAVLIGLAACILIGAGGSALADVQSGNKVTLHPRGPVPGSYIVVFEDDVTNVPAQARRLTRGTGVRLTHVYQFALKGFAGRMTAAQADALRNEPDVAYVEQDVYATTAGHSGMEEIPTGVDRIDADENPTAMTNGGYNFSVAVLDTGIDFQHPDLNVNTGLSVTCVEGSPIRPRCGPGGDDDNRHGTHVAGSIGAKSENAEGVVGVTAGIDLVAVKVLDHRGSGRASQLITGIDYVTANAPSNGGPIAVANMSLEFRQHVQAVCDAIANSTNAGVVHVAAAGNEGKSLNGNNSPGDCADVISVSALSDGDGQGGGIGIGAITCRTDEDDSFANFSNYGPDVHIMAPGVCIHSTYPTDLYDPPYGTISGTSMAAPHVAGAVALYIHTQGTFPTNASDVDAIRTAVISLGKDQNDGTYGLAEPDDPDCLGGSGTGCEPILYVNSAEFGGGGEVNSAPVVTITEPADGSSFTEGEAITFTGSASDKEDKDVTGSLTWTSDINGSIGSGGSFTSSTLGPGTHTITATATDSGGKTGSASITVIVCDASPSVTITEPADGSSFTEGETITFTGSATDCPDGDLSDSLSWSSDVDGPLGTGSSISTTLSVGTHKIAASATDSDGKSGSTFISVTVVEATTATSFDASIVYSSEGGRNNDKHLNSEVTITDGTNPVSGATVDATVTNTTTGESMSGTGTTDSTGLVIFSWKNAPSGCYDTTVNSVNGNTNVTEAETAYCK